MRRSVDRPRADHLPTRALHRGRYLWRLGEADARRSIATATPNGPILGEDRGLGCPGERKHARRTTAVRKPLILSVF
jgi:hypothetical protein